MRIFSYTQLTSFLHCEQQWFYRYVDRLRPRTTTRQLALGTLVHRMLTVWWEERGDAGGVLGAWNIEHEALLPAVVREAVMNDACWLLDRYAQVYRPPSTFGARVLHSEHEIVVPLPRPGPEWPEYALRMVLDRIVDWPDAGGPVLLEHKTMSQWRDERFLEVDPQLSTYLWGGRVAGIPLRAAFFDAVRTYRAKRETKPGDSFRRILVDRTAEEGLVFARAAYRACLAADQVQWRGYALRNVGQHCRWCDFGPLCLEAMRGDAPGERAIMDEAYVRREG